MASEVRRLTKALAFAAEAHRNQRRKGARQEPLKWRPEKLPEAAQVQEEPAR
jgi:hypothetical protein